jgi:group I intron endonuclease
MKTIKCGVYQIRCRVSGKLYVGSSVRIHQRWAEHRRHLRLGRHASPRLQRAWNKHGEENFAFSILEECARDVIYAREQHHIDLLNPDYNSMRIVTVISREMRSKMNAAIRARANQITQCPHGHEYTAENTYMNGNKRICRECNQIRSARLIANETPEQREVRRQRVTTNYMRTSREQGRSDRWSLEHRARISAGLVDREMSEETRRKISLAVKAGLTPERMEKVWAAARERVARVGGPRTGQSPTAETRAKIRAALTRANCAHGHPFDESNTLIDKRGKKSCKTCRNGRKREKRLALRQAV